MILTLLGVSILVFFMVHLIPGDPVTYILGDFATNEAVAKLRSEMGLDQPMVSQYLSFVSGVLQGDLGTSYITGQSVWEEIAQRFPITLKLGIISLLIGSCIGILFGVISAVNQNTWADYLVSIVSLLGVSAPGFWIALFFIYVFSFQLAIFPISGYAGWHSLILPSLTLGLGSVGNIARMTRSNMLEVLKQDYMRTALAKGTRYWKVIVGHGLKNAFIPVITLIGITFGNLLAGAIVTETVFGLPGMGSFTVESIVKRDIYTVQGLVMFLGMMFILTNLVVDLIYKWIDPRITLE